MAIFKINVSRTVVGDPPTQPSTITDLVESVTTCESIKTFNLNIPAGNTKYVTIITNGLLTTATGPTGEVGAGVHPYSLTIEGGDENAPDITTTSTIIVRVREFLGGQIENEVILTRAHDGIACAP